MGNAVSMNSYFWTPLRITHSSTNITFSNLTVGQNYYLVFDGAFSDECDFVIGLPLTSGVALPTTISPLTATICVGGTVDLTASGGDGTYDWSASDAILTLVPPSSGTLNSTTVPTVSSTAFATPGTYTYTVRSNSISTCPSNATATVIVLPAIATAAITGPTSVCVWSCSDLTKCTINQTGEVTAIAAGSVTISYTVCATPATLTVTVNALPVLTVTGDAVFCAKAPITLTGSPTGGSFSSESQSIGTINSTTGLMAGLTTGTTKVTYAYTEPVTTCSNTVDKTITVNAQPDITLFYPTIGNDNKCAFQPQDTLFMTKNSGGSGVLGTWTYETPTTSATVKFVSPTSLNTQIIVSEYGIYKFSFKESACNYEDTITINFTPIPYGELVTYTDICQGQSVVLTVENISNPTYLESIEWTSDLVAWSSNGETTTSITVSSPGEYTARLFNVCNPTGFALPSKIIIKTCDVVMPNVITPNGDNINDVYYIKDNNDVFISFNIVIVNRWGNVISEFDDPANGKWDGKTKGGDLVEAGVYFYYVKGITLDGKGISKQGFIHVIYE